MSYENQDNETGPVEHTDQLQYYRVLRLKPTASPQEIQLAYEMLTEVSDKDRGAALSAVERAYRILMNASSRQAYDRVCTATNELPTESRPLNDLRVLAASMVLLVGILGFVWAPLYGHRFKSFAAGDQLMDLKGDRFGVVVEVANDHDFSRGVAVEGILVKLEASGELRWFPASDIRATCTRVR